MFNTKLGITIFLLTLKTGLANSQSDYALMANGDTLRGELKFYLFENLDRLQIQSGGKKMNFTALQIKGFIKEGIKYQPVKYENSYRFMKIIKSGYLSLFAFNTTLSMSWDGLYIKKIDDSGIEVPNLGFKKIVSKYLSDCAEVYNKMDKGELRKKDIEEIVNNYNSCINAKTETINSKKISAADADKIQSIKNFIKDVESTEFVTKKDALDVLNDMLSKASKKEAIPNFLNEGLKSYLHDTPDLLKKSEELNVLLKK